MGTLLPADLLARIVASDSGRPRLTWYDDEPGDTRGERIELSARVLANWVAKAANLLQDDCAAGPGSTVGVDLPTHWRAVYWSMATWAVGATVVVGESAVDADVLVTDSPERAAGHGGDAVLVSLPALARSHPLAGESGGAIDEARELATHGDVFSPMADPEVGDVALASAAGDTTYGQVVVDRAVDRAVWPATPRLAIDGVLDDVLRDLLSAYAADGSVVLSRGRIDPKTAALRLASEGVTVDLLLP